MIPGTRRLRLSNIVSEYNPDVCVDYLSSVIVFVVVYFENRKETLTHVYLVLSSTQAINKFRIF